jgi:hypothetical protein
MEQCYNEKTIQAMKSKPRVNGCAEDILTKYKMMPK